MLLFSRFPTKPGNFGHSELLLKSLLASNARIFGESMDRTIFPLSYRVLVPCAFIPLVLEETEEARTLGATAESDSRLGR